MSRAFPIMPLLAMAIAVFIIASGSSGPAWAATAQMCSKQALGCLKTCKGDPGGEEHCRDLCVEGFINCTYATPKDKKSGIDPGDTGGSPPRKWQHPVNVGVIPPTGGDGTKPPKHPIGVNPVTSINPEKVEQPGSGSGAGVTILEKSGKGKTVTTIGANELTTIKEKDWPPTSGSSSSGQSQHHSRHR
jgi:hypothetical protein